MVVHALHAKLNSRKPAKASLLWKYWLRTARKNQDLSAVIDATSGDSLSFKTLRLQARHLAKTYLQQTPQTVVAFCLANSADWIVFFLALQSIDAIALPLDASTPIEARAERARESGATFLWDNGILIKLRSRRKVMLDISCIKTTSGSAGKSKGIACKAQHLIADGQNILSTMGITPSDINLGIIPFSHSYGLGNLIMPLILQGNPIVFSASYVPSQIQKWICAYKVTIFPSVPAVLHALSCLQGKEALKPLRLVISAGAPLKAETAQRFYKRFGLRIHNLYGSSETGSICFDRTGEASLTGRSVGTPLDNVQITLRRNGQVCVRSRAVAMAGGTHILPDFGEWIVGGELHLLGRKHGQANIGGRKVHPGEIERLLNDLPEIREAKVVVIQNPRDLLLAYVETDIDRETILQSLTKLLPAWKIPRKWYLSSKLPRNERGKIDLNLLRKGVT